jgi:hypothetical protein
MSYLIERYDEGRTIAVTFCSDFRAADDMLPMLAEINGFLDLTEGGVTIINNLDQASFTLDEVISSANLARQQDQSLFHHPKVKQIVGVSRSKLIQLSAKGLNSATFGNLSMPVFGTMEEALTHASS